MPKWAPSRHPWIIRLREGVPGAGASCLSRFPHVICGSLGYGKLSQGLRFHAQVGSLTPSVDYQAEGRRPRGQSFVPE